jgi:hypothetical protein
MITSRAQINKKHSTSTPSIDCLFINAKENSKAKL